MTDFETIKNQFESRAKCRHGNAPKINHDGCTWIECKPDDCKCMMADGEGIPLSRFLAEWMESFG
jgi:hypothetical protein